MIYVSHRFTEISELCHRASVLRDGRTVGDLRIGPVTILLQVRPPVSIRIGGGIVRGWTQAIGD